jgi:hypothetical protein
MSTDFLKARDIEAIALSTYHTAFDAEPHASGVSLPRPEGSVEWVLRSFAIIKRFGLALAFQR